MSVLGICLFLLIPVQATPEISPFYLDVHRPRSDRLEYVQDLIREYELDLPEQQLQNLKRAFPANPNWNANRQTVTGTLQFYDPGTRRIQTAQFWTMPDRDAFDNFVLAELERRGAHASVNGLGDSQVHFEKTPKIDGKWQLEVWAAYSDGVCVQGISKSVHSLKTKPIKEWLKAAKGKQTHVFVQVDAIPEELRESVLKRMRRQSNTRQQRRDGEPLIDYSIRRAIGDEGFRSIESAARQLRSVSFSTEQPNVNGGDWSVDIVMETKPNTPLREWLGQLVLQRPTLSVTQSTETVAEAQLSLRVPTDLKKTAIRLLQKLPEDRSPDALADIVKTIAAGRLEAVVAVPADETAAAVIGAVRFAGRLEPLLTLCNVKSFRDDQSSIPLEKLLGLDELNPYQLALQVDDGILRATVAEEPQDISRELLVTETRRQPSPLLHFKVDLAKWDNRGTEGSPSNEVLQKLESLTDQYHRWSRVNAIRSQVMASDTPANHKTIMVDVLSRNSKIPKSLSADFESVTQKTAREGDWTADGRVSFRNGALRIRARIGKDLYGLYQVRGLLAAARALRSVD